MSTTIGVDIMAESVREKFERQTKSGLEACSRWLAEHAGELAGTFSGGCRSWSVEFSAGGDGMFPEIDIRVNKVDRDVIDAYLEG